MIAKELTFAEKAFCHEYIVDFSGKDAVVRAGIKTENPTKSAWNMLRKVGVQQLLTRLMANREIRTEITQDRVLQEYAKIAFADMRKLYDDFGELKHVQDLDDDIAGALVSIGRLADKKAALDSIAKHLGMLSDNINIGGQPNNPIRTTEKLDLSELTNEQLAALKLLASANDKGDTGSKSD